MDQPLGTPDVLGQFLVVLQASSFLRGVLHNDVALLVLAMPTLGG